MVPGHDRGHRMAMALTLVSALAACSGDLFHSTAWQSECDSDPFAPQCTSLAGVTSATTSSSVTTSSSAASSGSGGSGGAATTSTSGGGGAGVCGDGTRDPGEQCDDGNKMAGDGCDGQCRVECSGTGILIDPLTFHCYKLDSALRAWGAAEMACTAWGGHLAAVTSAKEQQVIEPLLLVNAWIGATDAMKEGVWVWTTGEPFVFTNWNAGEPTGLAGEDCIVNLSSKKLYKWNDVICTGQRPSICERAPAGE